MNSIEERIKEFIVKRIPQGQQRDITLDDPLLEKGLLDSLGVLDVVAFLEQEFQTTIEDDDLTPENFVSIRSIAEFIRKIG